MHELHEDVKNLKAEVDTLKNNFKSVFSVRAEVESLNNFVKDIKGKIKQLKDKNSDIAERIQLVEEEIKDEAEDESDSDIDINLSHSKSKLNYDNHLKKIGHELKCDECDFVGNTDLSIKKHVNTEHSIQNIEEQENNSSKTDCTIDGIEGIEDMFQLEILDGEQVYACNFCDQGFDTEDEIRNHI